MELQRKELKIELKRYRHENNLQELLRLSNSHHTICIARIYLFPPLGLDAPATYHKMSVLVIKWHSFLH